MRTISLSISALAISLIAWPAHAAPTPILGKWKTDDASSVISFYKCGNAVCGKIDRFLVPEPAGGARDTENPDKSKRSDKLLGKPIFWSLTPDGNSFDGKGYSPKDGRYFNADISRAGADLKIKGCVAVFCRTVTFTKF